MNGRCESTLSLPVAFLVSFFHLFPLPVLASPHLFIHTSFSLRPCRHRSHSLSVSAITASHLRRHHHFFLSVSLSRLRLRGLNSPTTLTLLQASVGSTCIETMPPAFVECMQASIPILLLCVQIFSLCDLPLFSIQLDRYSQRRSYFLAVTSHPCSGTVVRIFAESLRIVVRTLPSPPSCFLSLINTIPTLRSQSNLHPRGAT